MKRSLFLVTVFLFAFLMMANSGVAQYVKSTINVYEDSANDTIWTIQVDDTDTSKYYDIGNYDYSTVTLFYYIDDLVTGDDSNDITLYFYQSLDPRSSVHDTSLADYALVDSIVATNTTTTKWSAHVLSLVDAEYMKIVAKAVATTGDSVALRLKLEGRFPNRNW
jgi:hypothetical protein